VVKLKTVFTTVAFFLAIAPAIAPGTPVHATPAGSEDYTFGETEITGANKLLFGTDHLESITEPLQLVYDFKKSGTLGKTFDDEIVITIKKVLSSGRKNISFRFLTGKNKIRFPSANGVNTNFVFQAFLENDVREMKHQTGGSALFFRNRIRHALAGNSQVVSTTFDFDGKTYEGKKIIVKPFSKKSIALFSGSEDMYSRFSKYGERTYVFVMSDQIPGSFFQISTVTPGDDENEPLTSEVMTFLGVKTKKK
jgi:hypothetical protein